MSHVRERNTSEHINREMIGFIYKTTCLVNGKIYIGKHEGDCNDNYLGSGELFLKAVRKYGRKNFKREILRHCNTLHELKIWEHVFIKKYHSQNPEIGYNIADGDVNTTEFNPAKLPLIRKKMSCSIKKAYSNSKLRQKKSEDTKKYFEEHPEARLNLSEHNKQRFQDKRNHPMYGKKQSVESNEKNRQSHLGTKLSEETKRKISQSVLKRYKLKNDKVCNVNGDI